jgi:hypothetical protein
MDTSLDLNNKKKKKKKEKIEKNSSILDERGLTLQPVNPSKLDNSVQYILDSGSEILAVNDANEKCQYSYL